MLKSSLTGFGIIRFDLLKFTAEQNIVILPIMFIFSSEVQKILQKKIQSYINASRLFVTMCFFFPHNKGMQC